MKDLLKLNYLFARYKRQYLLGTLFLTVANLFLVWNPVFIREAIDQAGEIAGIDVEQVRKSVQEAEKSGSDTADIGVAGLAPEKYADSIWEALFSQEVALVLAENSLYILGVSLMYGCLLFATRQTIIVASRKVEFDLRNEIYAHLQRLPQSFFASNKSGDIYVKAAEDVSSVRSYFGPAFMYVINTITRMGIIIGLMLYVNVELTLWALIPLPFLAIMAYWISEYINILSTKIQEQYSELAGVVQESFSSIRLIKAYGREDYEQKRFDAEAATYRKRKLKLSALEAAFMPMLNLLIGLSVIMVVWQGGYMAAEGTVSVGNIAEFIIYVTYLTWPVASLGYTLNMIQRSAASQRRIADMMREPALIEDSEFTDANIKDIEGRITFENVSFSYPGTQEPALKKLDFDFKAGTNIAIVGRTGSGKSTLVQLLPRLFEPTEGRILIDGRPIKDIPIRVLRESVGFVPQETFLFSDTIHENIAFGLDNANEEQVMEAAEKAQILDNILDFEKKFETMLGERGITLSGGQKQRSAIARALIKNPKILIFDDSLSAVDTKTEEAILDHLRTEMVGKTSITISHRISTVQNADVILVLKDGALVESGAHNELIGLGGHYADMYQKQLIEDELAEI